MNGDSRRTFLRQVLLGGAGALLGARAREAFAAGQGDELRFLVVADTHIGSPGDAERFRRVLPLIAAEQPELILHAGDLVNDSIRNRGHRRAARALLRQLPIPPQIVPGNHDIDWGGDPGELAAWRGGIGPTELLVKRRGWSFIGFNAMALSERCAARSEAERVLGWLERTCVRIPPGRAILFGHLPNYRLPLDWNWAPGWTATARARFAAVVGRLRPPAMIAGHWHVGVRIPTTPCAQIVAPAISGRFQMETGYLRCRIKADRLLVERVMIETQNKRKLPTVVSLFLLPTGAPPRPS